MGWLVMIVFVPLKNTILISGIIFLLSGGIVYTVGAIIYALKPPKLNFKLFGIWISRNFPFICYIRKCIAYYFYV